jgi:uncharacterized Zn finger protein
MSWEEYGWRPYVPVEQRRRQARAYAASRAKKEKRELCPVQASGKKIARSFWGQAWCDNLNRYSDFENRLPRGRTYLRNGSIVDLQISAGEIRAIVGGSEVYEVNIRIRTLEKRTWTCVKRDCASGIASLIDLLQGRFDEGVMRRLTQPDKGLFPRPKEIDISCTCPDWAVLCKHAAAVLYGIGARLDNDPELLFTLRAVDHLELIEQAGTSENLHRSLSAAGGHRIEQSELGAVFGIDIDQTPSSTEPAVQKTSRRPAKSGRRAGTKKAEEADKTAAWESTRRTRKTNTRARSEPGRSAARSPHRRGRSKRTRPRPANAT